MIRSFRLERDAMPADIPPLAIPSALSSVQLWYRLNGELALEPHASGFVIDPWPQHLITARHAVTPRENGTHVAIDIVFGDANDRIEVPALAVAYPDDEDTTHDLAVIHLARRTSGPLLKVAREIPDDQMQADVEVLGRPDDEAARVATRVARDGRWLLYLTAGGRAGMSGGPVLCGEAVIGVHVRERAALLADFKNLLGECMTASALEARNPKPSPVANINPEKITTNV